MRSETKQLADLTFFEGVAYLVVDLCVVLMFPQELIVGWRIIFATSFEIFMKLFSELVGYKEGILNSSKHNNRKENNLTLLDIFGEHMFHLNLEVII